MGDDCVEACCAGCIEGVCIACCATVGTLCCDLVCRPVCGRCCNSCFDRCEDCCGCASSSSSRRRRRRQRSYSYEEAARYSNEGINANDTYDPPIVVVPVKVQPPASSLPHGAAGGDVTQAYSAPTAGYPMQTTATDGQYPPSNQEMNRHAG